MSFSTRSARQMKGPSSSTILLISTVFFLEGLNVASGYGMGLQGVKRLPSPYPPSPVIERMDWDLAGLRREAPGSDIWATTWATTIIAARHGVIAVDLERFRPVTLEEKSAFVRHWALLMMPR
jgi:hypothetical protein